MSPTPWASSTYFAIPGARASVRRSLRALVPHPHRGRRYGRAAAEPAQHRGRTCRHSRVPPIAAKPRSLGAFRSRVPWGGALATGCGVVFYGTLAAGSRRRPANGKVLWHSRSARRRRPSYRLTPARRETLTSRSFGSAATWGCLCRRRASNLPFDVKKRERRFLIVRYTSWGGNASLFFTIGECQ